MVGEPVDLFGGGGELDPVPGLASADHDAGGQVGLAGGWVWGLLYPPPPPSGSGPSGGLGYTTDNDHGYTGPRCYEPDGYHFNPC